MPHRIESPFSFRLAEKKTAIHGHKKRLLGMSWPLMGQLTQNEGLTGTHCRQNPEISCRLRRQMFLE